MMFWTRVAHGNHDAYARAYVRPGRTFMHLIIKERKGFPRFLLPKYLIGREQKFQHSVSFDWSRNKRKAVYGLFPSF